VRRSLGLVDDEYDEDEDEDIKLRVEVKLIQKGGDGLGGARAELSVEERSALNLTEALVAEEKLGEDEEGFDIRIGDHGWSSVDEGDGDDSEDSMDYDGHSNEGQSVESLD